MKIGEEIIGAISGGPTFLGELKNFIFWTGVADPWHFGTDPDPRIRASD